MSLVAKTTRALHCVHEVFANRLLANHAATTLAISALSPLPPSLYRTARKPSTLLWYLLRSEACASCGSSLPHSSDISMHHPKAYDTSWCRCTHTLTRSKLGKHKMCVLCSDGAQAHNLPSACICTCATAATPPVAYGAFHEGSCQVAFCFLYNVAYPCCSTFNCQAKWWVTMLVTVVSLRHTHLLLRSSTISFVKEFKLETPWLNVSTIMGKQGSASLPDLSAFVTPAVTTA